MTIYLSIFALVVALIVVFVYNGIVGRMNAVERAWADVMTQERQKNKIIPHLEEVVKRYQAYEESLQTKITALRTSLQRLQAGNVDTDGLADTEQKTRHLMEALNVAVENYPELKASEAYNNLMREIAEQQDNIGAAIRIFNQNVEDFNNGIEVFPNAWINQWLNKKERIKTFTDSEAESGFEYSPNIRDTR